jgi:hypothetical protein
VAANRDYLLNNINIGYHNENMECYYTVKFPYYVGVGAENNEWLTSYYSSPLTNTLVGDLNIKTAIEDPNQT